MNTYEAEFWIALLQIIGIDIVLSGDNAVVIALATRSLPLAQQRRAIRWGTGAAVAMRIALTVLAVQLLTLPWLRLIGSLLLLWIALQLLMPDDGHGDHKGTNGGMIAAIRTILVADFVMSIDNVVAVAAASKGSLTLLMIGLALSIPLVVFTSTLLLKLMTRWPIIIVLGAALLGWVAGEMAVSDVISAPWVEARAPWLHTAVPAACALLVVVLGKWLAARKQTRMSAAPIIDLTASDKNQGKKP